MAGKWIGIGAYAATHGVSVSTVRRWRKEGRIEGRQSAGGRWFFREDAEPGPSQRLENTPRTAATHNESDSTDETADEVWSLPRRNPRLTEHSRLGNHVAHSGPELFHPPQSALTIASPGGDSGPTAGGTVRDQIAEATARRRLDNEKTQARLQVASLRDPADARVDVEEFLASLKPGDPPEYVAAKITAILKPYQEAEKEDLLVEQLLAAGTLHAAVATSGFEWDRDAAREARDEVERILRRRIQPDWTEERVNRLVDAVLDRWE